MKIKELFEEQAIDIKITNDDLDSNGRLLKSYENTKVGDFFCFETNITSLEGAPRSVGGSFDCDNTKITSLEGAPQKVGDSFYCYDTKITSLKGIGKDFLSEVNGLIDLDGCEHLSGGFLSLFRVKGLKRIRFNVNENVQDIYNRHLEGDRDLLDCKEELMNAGFKEFAKL